MATAKIGLNVPTIGATNWGSDVNTNWNKIDSAALLRNKVINGTGVLQQRSTATLTKDTYAFATDRCAAMVTGTTASGSALKDSSATIGRTGYAHKITATLTGTGVVYWRTRIESLDARTLKNVGAYFSCVVAHDVGTSVNFSVTLRKANATDNFTSTTAISNGSTTLAVASGTTGAILAFAIPDMSDCGNGVEIEIKAEPGSITSKNFWLTEVQLEQGVASTGFEYRLFQQELAMCQRYFCKSFNIDTAPADAVQNSQPAVLVSLSATVAYTDNIVFPVSMRSTTPAISFFRMAITGTSGRWQWFNGSWIDSTSTAIVYSDQKGFYAQMGSTATNYAGLGTSYIIGGDWTADAEL